LPRLGARRLSTSNSLVVESRFRSSISSFVCSQKSFEDKVEHAERLRRSWPSPDSDQAKKARSGLP